MASAGSVGIGRIYGIPIELNWIFVLMILFFFLLSPAFGIILILLFVCVLIHELAHSVTAIRNRVKVSRIVLLPFGGASVIDTTKINSRVEFNISIAGPLMSLFLGGVFGIIAVVLPPGPIEQVVNELFILNIFLGAFNIIPAFPMDGGRIFRSWLEKKRSFYDATMLTAAVSRVVLAIIILTTIGFALFYTSYSLGYRVYVVAITLIIVVFLYGGLQAEVGSVSIRKETAGMKVGAAASKHFTYMEPDATIEELYEKVRSSGDHTIITKVGDSYGIVNLARAKKGVVYTVSQISVPIITIDANASVSDGMSKLTAADVGIAAVKRGRTLVGVLSYQQLQTLISLHMLQKRREKASASSG